jgi:hypothetical protein
MIIYPACVVFVVTVLYLSRQGHNRMGMGTRAKHD